MSDDENGEIEVLEDAPASTEDDDESPAESISGDAEGLLDDPEQDDEEDEDTDKSEVDASGEDDDANEGEPDAEAAAGDDSSVPIVKATPPPRSAPEVDLSTLKVGDRVKCWCGKIDCKDFTLHKVTELPEGKKPRSACLQCGAVHFVRLQMPGSSRRATPAVNPWIKAVAGVTGSDATQYTLQGAYTIDEFVVHKKFGLGKVLDRISDKKISVLFEHGTKLLVQQHGR